MPYATRKSDPDGAAAKKKTPKNAKKYLVWLVSRMEYSAADLRKKLISKEFPIEEVDAAMAFAQLHGFQSDERFVVSKTRNAASRQGNYRLKQKLAQKGISSELSQAQIDTLAPEEERVLGILRRFEGLPLDQKLREKIYRFLASRGFSSRPIKVAFAHLEAKLRENNEAEINLQD